jgi:diguanylate cyclase (GGDEF)-like protein/PAS domain S-box-containing protein
MSPSILFRPHGLSSRWLKVASVFALIFLTLGMLGMMRLRLLSSIRAQVAAESLYSKSQKDAVLHLLQYAATGDERDYGAYRQNMTIPMAGRLARFELAKPNPNFALARRGMLSAGNGEVDADDMIFAFQTSQLFGIQIDAASAWNAADRGLIKLDAEAENLHNALRSVNPDSAIAQQSLARIGKINRELADIEYDLAERLERAGRHAQQILLVASWALGITLILGGIAVARRMWLNQDQLALALRTSEQRLQLAMDGSNDGLWDWDIVNDTFYYSPRMLEMLEVQGKQTGASRFLHYAHPEDVPSLRRKLIAHLRDQSPFDVEFRAVTAKGNLRWMRSRAQSARLASGWAVRMAGSLTDITERKRNAELLHAEKERAQVTLESIGDAVITVDTKGRIEYLNPAAVVLTGWRIEEAKGNPAEEVCELLEEQTRLSVADVEFQARKHDVTLQTNLLLVGRDGHEVAVNRSIAQLLDREGKPMGTVWVLHDVSKDRAYATHLSYQANHDELTGLINRREFERRLNAMLANATFNRQHSMLYIDLDQFKIVNDTCGHLAGDELLKQLGERLKSKLRQNDALARLGGDEFGVLLEACPIGPALKIAELLRQAVADFHFTWSERSFPSSASIGLVTFGEQPATLADVLRMADAACYLAKDHGRNRVHVFSQEDQELAQRQGEMGWIGRIRQALEEDRFVLFSQPILPLSPNRQGKTHCEILLRLKDENDQIVPPIAFIPAAERYGLMPAIDRWVIRNALALHAERARLGVEDEMYAINLSGTSMGDVDFLPFVREQFQLTNVPPPCICFEITETAAIANLAKAAVLIRTLRDLGCRIALDDFGSGMSSFSYLKHLPVDYLKIDGSFVKDMAKNPIDHAMVEAINRVGQVMRIETIAEFVESEETLRRLKIMGVDFAQGYAIGKPALHLVTTSANAV